MTLLRDLVVETKDGEWGEAEASTDTIEMRVLRGTDFEDFRLGQVDKLPIRHVSVRHAQRKTLQANDIIIETAGGSKDRPTGRTVFVSPTRIAQSDRPLVPASFARFLRIDGSKVSSKFLFWKLQAMYGDGTLKKYHTQHTGIARFQFTTFATSEQFNLPKREKQERIASILSAYDDLIENSTRRIAILEEMARRIFEEWFVHFRAPGCEGLPLIDSPLGPIPRGWEVKRLDELASIQMGQSPKSDFYNQNGDGLPFHQGVTDFGDFFPTNRVSCTELSRLGQAGDILVSVRAPVGRLNLALEKMVIGRGLSAIRAVSERIESTGDSRIG